jgi:integrase
MIFREAADRFLTDRLAHLTPKGVQIERERGKPLKTFFGSLSLGRITLDAILAYVAERKRAAVSNATINRELDVLRGVLKRAKRWHLFGDDIKPLPVRHDTGRALSYEEKVRLTKLSGERPEWGNARLAMTLALNTTMRGRELKGLHWREINFIDRALLVCRNATKTDAGERVIPLNDDAWTTILELWERAKALSGTNPDHYVFPSCENKRVEPARPMKSWRSAWRSLTRAAGLWGLRFHDMRHHAITELSESEASDQTIMSIAGHVSPRMLAHYSHVRLEAKRRARDALSRKPSELTKERSRRGGYGTYNVTNGERANTAEPQV